MLDTTQELADRAAGYARVALENIEREFPHSEHLFQPKAGPVPRPRELHPAFYGSLDWHSCVAMHWLLVRLLRLLPDQMPQDEIRAALAAHLTADTIGTETRYFAEPDHQSDERPYGWGWALRLGAQLDVFDDADVADWGTNLKPLAELFVNGLLEWLPKLTYPIRYGIHANPAFALSLSLPFAERDPRLYGAVREAAIRWYGHDAGYAAEWEPSAFDFISPALTEAELMSSLLPQQEFAGWLDRFLPALADGEPEALFAPVEVSDPDDGLIAHLHGLNLSRAWCWRRLAAALSEADPRTPTMLEAAERHASASLGQAVDSNYHLEHWLPAYAVLYLSEGAG